MWEDKNEDIWLFYIERADQIERPLYSDDRQEPRNQLANFQNFQTIFKCPTN